MISRIFWPKCGTLFDPAAARSGVVTAIR